MNYRSRSSDSNQKVEPDLFPSACLCTHPEFLPWIVLPLFFLPPVLEPRLDLLPLHKDVARRPRLAAVEAIDYLDALFFLWGGATALAKDVLQLRQGRRGGGGGTGSKQASQAMNGTWQALVHCPLSLLHLPYPARLGGIESREHSWEHGRADPAREGGPCDSCGMSHRCSCCWCS